MDYKKFLEELSIRLDVSTQTVASLTEALAKEIAVSAAELDTVVVPGFGTFTSRLREERVAVHPASGKRLLVPPRIYLSFKQSPLLKQKINGK